MPLGEEHLFHIVLAAMAGGAIFLFIRWTLSGPSQADPWGEKVALEMESAESVPVCHRCFTEHSDFAHFCPQCGAAVGEFNNLMPFERLFSVGEVLRNGTTMNMRRNVPMFAGYVILSCLILPIFAPVYWFFLFRNFFRRQHAEITSEVQ